jgi:hypothetical protein
MQEILNGLQKINKIQKNLYDLADTFNKFGTLLNNMIQQQSQNSKQNRQQLQPN